MKRIISLLILCSLICFPYSSFGTEHTGGKRITDTLVGHGWNSFTFYFNKNSVEQIRVTGDLKSNLDCYLMDENENQIASDEDDSDTCVFTDIIQDQKYWTVYVFNRGDATSTFVIESN